MKYDADYFIAKFEAIPEELWISEEYGDGKACCALGHCGCHDAGSFYNPEAEALRDLALVHLGHRGDVISVNDGDEDTYPQPTPKQRVLAWLRDAKEAGL